MEEYILNGVGKKKELNEAIELQEFERAAQLRDEIKEIEKEKDKE